MNKKSADSAVRQGRSHSKDLYQQCKFQKGNSFFSSYIPAKFAKVGKVLKFKEDNNWDDGWRVIEVWTEPQECTPDVQKEIRQHRRNTGDSLPKVKK